ncbi:c-type cytochrome [Methylomagnum ishizawai]|uniref:c-type cytochrome n=1 Tax=Methylomagnum ishizawai TaxID=1760988 RepID=UPI001C338CD8|nr:cytochrome c [Methylomagnum ishizawai]BBL73621.1 cytochrome c [Methylomagnum ishizawai]
MSTPKRLAAALVSASLWVDPAQAAPEGPELGRPATPQEIAAQDINVFPDGSGLPPGQGTVAAGKALYASRCAGCHGPQGVGGSAEELAGGSPPNSPHPDRTLGAYWPYATTVFDYVRRAMPIDAPRSLDDNQVYAVTAYLLHLNGLLGAQATLDAKTLAAIKMPNRDGFQRVWPEHP